MAKDADWGSSGKNASSNGLMTAGGTIFGNSDETYVLPEGHPKHTSSSAGNILIEYLGKVHFQVVGRGK